MTPGRRPDGQPEPDRPGQQRVDAGAARRRPTASERTARAWRPMHEGGGPERGHHPGRSTDGSARRQHDEPADQRQRDGPARRTAGRGRSRGPAAARSRATFCPDTAVRCASPLSRKRCDHLRRLVAVVADDEASGQRRWSAGSRRPRAGSGRGRGSTRRRSGRRGATSPSQSASNDPTTCCHATRPSPVVVERGALAADEHPIAGPPLRRPAARRARPRTHSSWRSPSISRITRLAPAYGWASSTTRDPPVERAEPSGARPSQTASERTTPPPARSTTEQGDARPPAEMRRDRRRRRPTATHERVATPRRRRGGSDHDRGVPERRAGRIVGCRPTPPATS